MEKSNHALKARMYLGGLKSMFVDFVTMIEEIEKTGEVSKDFVEGLENVKSAIDLTTKEFSKMVIRCCEHGTAHEECDEECKDEEEVVEQKVKKAPQPKSEKAIKKAK
jgi:hypothetical protein